MATTQDLASFKASIDIVQVIGCNVELKKSGNKFKGKCPFHDDHAPSMDVDPGKRRFHCWACGEGGDVFDYIQKHHRCDLPAALEILGYEQWKSPTQKAKPVNKSKGNPFDEVEYVEEYSYEDENGQYLSTKIRFDKKDGTGKTFKRGIKMDRAAAGFSPRNFTWTLDSLKERKNVLFHLVQVKLAIAAGATIYLCEGEKAVLRMEREGVFATCSPQGATPATAEKLQWDSPNTEVLRGAHVVIIADRDEVGERHAGLLFKELQGKVKSLGLVSSKTTNLKDDAFDHLEAGFAIGEFVPRPEIEDPTLLKAFDVPAIESYIHENPCYLWDPYLRKGTINLIDAKGGSGKTTFGIALAVQGSLGLIPWQGPCEKFKTLYFGHEDTPGEMRVVYENMGGQPGHFFPMADPFQLTDENLERIEATIKRLDVKLVIFDAITYFVSSLIKNPLNGMEIQPFLAKLMKIAQRTGVCILNIRHFKKGATSSPVDEMGSGHEQWRNSHRSQLVLRPHPDKQNYPRYGIIFHEKGSLNSPMGPPFGFQFRDGLFGWVHPKDIDPAVFDGQPSLGRPPKAKQDAKQFLKDFFGESTIRRANEAKSAGRQKGLSDDTLSRALKALGGSWEKDKGDHSYWWILPTDALPGDPFAND